MKVCIAVLLAASPALAQPEYEFHLVEPFESNGITECYVWDINENDTASGTSTFEAYYSGFAWTLASDKGHIEILWPYGINNLNQAVGQNLMEDVDTGELTPIPALPGTWGGARAQGINDLTFAVGYSKTCNCSNSSGMFQVPFYWSPGTGTVEVQVPSAKDLFRVNNSNVAVGVLRYGAGVPDALVYNIDTGEWLALGDLLPPPVGSTLWMTAVDISDAGVVTGVRRTDDALTYRGYTWSEAAGFTFLPSLTGGESPDVRPSGINVHGTVVGTAKDTAGENRAFVWEAGKGTRDLNFLTTTLPPNFILDRAQKINDHGWIVGDGHFGPNWGPSFGFVLVPVVGCEADCDASGSLDIDDFVCFQTLFAIGSDAADCDGDGALTIDDFICFQTEFAVGCP